MKWERPSFAVVTALFCSNTSCCTLIPIAEDCLRVLRHSDTYLDGAGTKGSPSEAGTWQAMHSAFAALLGGWP
jgi:hypothetical protein